MASTCRRRKKRAIPLLQGFIPLVVTALYLQLFLYQAYYRTASNNTNNSNSILLSKNSIIPSAVSEHRTGRTEKEGEESAFGNSSISSAKKKEAPPAEDVAKEQQQQPFPRWDDADGIPLDPLLAFARGVLHHNASVFPAQQQIRSTTNSFPELPYVVDAHGVWTSSKIRKRIPNGKLVGRVLPTERLMVLAWRHLMAIGETNATTDTHTTTNHTHTDDTHRWLNLRRVITRGGGRFPWIVLYVDAAGRKLSCNHRNWNDHHSIPIFTTCARVDCRHAWPFPTYKTASNAKHRSVDWTIGPFADSRDRYPWPTKIRRAVWRGSLTGGLHNYTSPRARMGVFAAKVAVAPSSDSPLRRLFDVGLTGLRGFGDGGGGKNRKTKSKPDEEVINVTALGGLATEMSMVEFQNYAAIIDTDGNSWSGRFNALLCYNSVILKVEPRYVDYHFHQLRPWEHYVPVRYDLSDLEEKARWALDPGNERQVLEIVAAANDWCRIHETDDSLARDVLDVWDAYVGHLDRNDPSWADRWSAARDRELFAPEFGMVRVRSVPASEDLGSVDDSED